MAYVVTDHRKYKYFDDLRSAAEYIRSQNDSSLKLYEDTGWGALKEIPPLKLLQMLEGSSYSPSNAAPQQAAQKSNENIQKEEQQQQPEKQQSQQTKGKKKKEPESSISGILVSLLVKIAIVITLLILYFVFLPQFINNALQNIPVG
jgi:uncharacterized protein YqhQ